MPYRVRASGPTQVMGVLNVTPDSFSDGGRWTDVDAAVAHGIAMHRAGAALVDVGGESTRPGAERVDAEVECARVLPVVAALVAAGVPVSIDTSRAVVADRALSAGAVVVNDVSGGQADPELLRVAASAGVPLVLMHWRGPSRGMRHLATYDDVLAEVRTELLTCVDAAVAAGVAAEDLVLDPGLGFAKRAGHNWTLLQGLGQLIALGFPVLVGASRKAFLGQLLDGRPAAGRDAATTAVTALAAAAGAWMVRVHDVGPSVDAARVGAAWAGPDAVGADGVGTDGVAADRGSHGR